MDNNRSVILEGTSKIDFKVDNRESYIVVPKSREECRGFGGRSSGALIGGYALLERG